MVIKSISPILQDWYKDKLEEEEETMNTTASTLMEEYSQWKGKINI